MTQHMTLSRNMVQFHGTFSAPPIKTSLKNCHKFLENFTLRAFWADWGGIEAKMSQIFPKPALIKKNH